MENKRGQLTIFIIIAIIIFGAIVCYFAFSQYLKVEEIPAEMKPVYTSFLTCLEEDALIGIDILETQAGYIYLPDFEPGSLYMPFSSQLDFLGNPIPYWYYVSGNNVEKEQLPSEKNMESELKKFIEDKISSCKFDEYYDEGFEISQGEPKAETDIRDNEVKVKLNMNLGISKGEESVLVKNHEVSIKSKLGKLYGSAKKIYEKEQEDLFLENYAVDTLRVYAPVDGVEITCSPKVWSGDGVFNELEDAIEANTLALKIKGGDYSLTKKENEYFVIDIPVEGNVRFINSKNWPHSFEVAPSEGSVLMATPVGNQLGLGILGFCYVPYHFVYNIKYPVLVQVQDGEEIFQFPVAVIVEGNKPREPLEVSAVEVGVPELCKYKNTLISVKTYDMKLSPVEADISYECLGGVCEIGKTSSGSLQEKFPQCVNGYVIARAEGFEEAKKLHSTVEESSVSILLDKFYEMNVELKLDGKSYGGQAMINFVSDDVSKSVVYPEQKSVKLSEGQYEIQVYIYRDSSLKLEATITEECVEVPRSGLGGLFGMTKKKCFDIEIPAQIVSNALSGGGKQNYYVLDSELASSNTLEVNAQSLPSPNSLEQLQMNYILFEDKGLDIVFR